MNILSVAYPLFPVSADSSGGAEQILHLLERGLVNAGHRSFVIAAEGSQVAGTLVASEAGGARITDDGRSRAQQAHRQLIEDVLDREQIDLVHFHGLDFACYLPANRTPIVATLHLPPSWYAPETFELDCIDLVCVSRSQAVSIPDGRQVTVIENGIDPIGKQPGAVRREGLLWLGRICPEKGTHIALRVAHHLDLALTVAGPVHGFASHIQYFQEEVEPLLDDRRRYVGAVGKAEKTRLLRQAQALLIPSLAAETSSLVAMEAISAGTPVIAFAAGALPEIVEHGLTGFVVDSEGEMVEAIGKIDELAPVGFRFGVEGMVEKYLSLYDRVIKRRHFGIAAAPQEAL